MSEVSKVCSEMFPKVSNCADKAQPLYDAANGVAGKTLTASEFKEVIESGQVKVEAGGSVFPAPLEGVDEFKAAMAAAPKKELKLDADKFKDTGKKPDKKPGEPDPDEDDSGKTGHGLALDLTVPFTQGIALTQAENPTFPSSLFSSKPVNMTGLAGVRIVPKYVYKFDIGEFSFGWPVHIQNWSGKVTVLGVMNTPQTDKGSMLTLTTGPELALKFKAGPILIGAAFAFEIFSSVLSSDVAVGVSVAGGNYDPGDDLDVGDFFRIVAKALFEYPIDVSDDGSFQIPIMVGLGYCYTEYEHNGGGLTMPYTVRLAEGEHTFCADVGAGLKYIF